MPDTLEHTLHAISPRFTRPPAPAASYAIHGAVALLWAALLARAFVGHGLGAWSVGIVYIAYDTLLLGFTFVETWPLRRLAPQPLPARAGKTLTVVIAAYNEAAVIEATILALMAQTEPPETIIVADDGSTDATGQILAAKFGLAPPLLGTLNPPGPLRWLRAPHGGKARALNAALPAITTELFVTVDADTQLAPDALAAMRAAFAQQPGLVAATGVLTPACEAGFSGRCFEWFQTYEYIRNFLGRFAWGRMDSLLLISGAFAGFDTQAVMTVGGFDADCLVEDYELIHRLRRYGYDHALGWHSAVVGAARARTSAPGTVMAFLRQRRRWFGGFLQTQYWYKDMVGAARYRRLGLMMLPVKAADTFQPIYGLCAFALLLDYVATGRLGVLLPAGAIILAKIALDLVFHLWSINLYRRWAGPRAKLGFGLAILASFAEPFSFQLLRHLGACWGWLAFLTGRRNWGASKRVAAKAV